MASVRPRKVKGKLVKDKQGLTIFRAWIPRGKKPDGSYDVETVTLHAVNQREAEREAERIELAGYRTRALTVAEYAEQWLGEVRKRLAETTVVFYGKVIRKHILPHIGGQELADVEPRDVAALMLTLEGTRKANEELLSGHTRLKVYRTLSVMFQHAVWAGLCDSNPVRAVKPPRREPHKATYYQQEEILPFWTALQREPLVWRTIISIALLTGVRRGELVGLQWQDIDTARRLVRIERAAAKVPGKDQYCKSPKSLTSIRAIDLPVELDSILQEWRKAQGGTATDYICAVPSAQGLEWLKLDAVTRRYNKFVTDHQLRSVNLHGLRHTYATMQLHAGTPLHDVQELLGHAQASTTNNTYGHSGGGRREKVQTAISASISPSFSPFGENDGENEHERS